MLTARRYVMGLIAIAMVGLSCHADPYERLEPVEEEIAGPAWEPMRVVEGEELSDAELAAMQGLLPPLEEGEADRVDFKRRDETLEPPRPGRTVEAEWPPAISDPSDAPDADAESIPGSLSVQAFRPRGDVELPFQVAVAFDRPVVEVGEVGSQTDSALRIEPDVRGRWRWLDTRTAVFESDHDWSNSTEYEVEVSAGLEAVDGTELEDTFRFSFVTPTVSLRSKGPFVIPRRSSLTYDVDAPIVLIFDQPVRSMAPGAIAVRADKRIIPTRQLEGGAKLEVMEEYGLTEHYDEAKIVALEPRINYPEGSMVIVEVDGTFLSMEGPIVGFERRSSMFRVRGPLDLAEVRCRGTIRRCEPDRRISLQFSNPIEEASVPEQIAVTPDVENLEIEQNQPNRVWLTGKFESHTEYEIHIGEELTDIFGQRLENRIVERIWTGEPRYEGVDPLVAGPDWPLLVQPLKTAPVLPLEVAAIDSMRLRIYRASPQDWHEFFGVAWRDVENVPFELRRSEVLEFSKFDDGREAVPVALDSALPGDAPGHAVVIVDEVKADGDEVDLRYAYWIQRTDLAVDESHDGERSTAVVTRLSDGERVERARVRSEAGRLGITDAAGVVTFTDDEESRWIVVERGDDSLVIPGARTRVLPFGRSMPGRDGESDSRALWYVFDDRQTYRPEETVEIWGWLRRLDRSPSSDPESPPEGTEVSYVVRDQRRNTIGEGTTETDGTGRFALDIEIPDGANTGRATAVLTATVDGQRRRYRHRFEIQEFRRPDFEVQMRADEGPHVAGESATWEASASYYSSGVLSRASTTWRFEENWARFSPPGWSGWIFGSFTAWWYAKRDDDESTDRVLPAKYRVDIDGDTGTEGRDTVEMDLGVAREGRPRRIMGTVSIRDHDRQSWEARDTVLVHPAAVYAGLRSEDRTVHRDDDWEVEMAAVGIDGEAREGYELDFQLRRRRTGGWDEAGYCRVVSKLEPVTCSFSELRPGRYEGRVVVSDEDGRQSKSSIVVTVVGQDRRRIETTRARKLSLIPERDEVAPGETLQLTVEAPYYPLDAILELRRDGQFERRDVVVTEDDPTVEIEISEDMIPNVHVRMMALAGDGEYAPDRFASGSLEIPVSRSPRRLDVDIEPREDVIEPGAELEVEAVVRDDGGRPVEGAQVMLFAVDESVLSLSEFELDDPVRAFYPRRPAGVYDLRTRSWMLVERDEFEELDVDPRERREGRRRDVEESRKVQDDPEEVGEGRWSDSSSAGLGRVSGVGAGGMAALGHADRDDSAASMAETIARREGISVRQVFDALAFHRGDLRSDDEGRVVVREDMPESLTRHRIMAVAVDGDRHFGTGEGSVAVRTPLMVDPSPPRFLNVGDYVDLPVMVHNRTEEPMEVAVALQTTSVLRWLETPGRRVEIPARERLELRFAAQVQDAGTARIQVAAVGGEYEDAEEIEIPVLTPATTEAFATYGTIDADDEDALLEMFRVPQNVYSQFGGLDVTTSSTGLQALTDALIYLVSYRFYCAEQTASRVLSVLTLYDVLDAFDAPGLPSRQELEASVQEWVDGLVKLQRDDGGFRFWPMSEYSNPVASIHATRALWEARNAGYDVDEEVLTRAEGYLRQMQGKVENLSPGAQASVEAYALRVRFVMNGDRWGSGKIERELDSLLGRFGVDDVPLEALGWLLPLTMGTEWHERFLSRITSQVQETAATAEFQENEVVDGHRILRTGRRTDAVVLDGLIQVAPEHPLIDKVARGLLEGRTRGRWTNTQDNAFAVKALRRYFETYEEEEPDFLARIWVGGDQVGEREFAGRNDERYGLEVPMRYLLGGAEELPVTFQRDGEGRMYYRMGIRYMPTSRMVAPAMEGFSVRRSYEAVDHPSDVRRTDDGSWEIRAGARVRVELEMAIPARRYHVALVDWLPAGLEPLNPELEVTEVESGLFGRTSTARRGGWWTHRWHGHENLRDERVEAFARSVGEGVHTYSYVTRATTPGKYVAMPAKAEEMYHPETFGRTGSEIVRVVDEMEGE